MSRKINVDVNQFPSLTWNFLKINRTHFDSVLENDAGFTAVVSDDEIEFSETDFSSLSDEEKSVLTGLGKEFDAEFDLFAQNGKTVHITVPACRGCSSSYKIKIELEHHDGEAKAKDFVIHALASSDVAVIFTFKGAPLNEGVLGARVRVVAEENARVKIAAVNLLGKKAVCFLSSGSIVKDNASVDFTELELGGLKVFSGNHELLSGYKSSFTGRTAYIAGDESVFDFNYVARQTGKQTESSYAADGVCFGNAKKTWRGTIDFVKGCVDSKGNEEENVLLLSPKVLNKTLPVILCDEEAVEGRHGSSIGKLDSDVLFYMQSRGLSEKEAQRLVVSAKVHSACRHIPDDEVNENVDSFLHREFGE